ncbi:hypothetical protein C8R43DRAFT_881169 [Mycena crocata]|nr:hypothetical protein C8R43DRAFT_881169 [Mycena crocata]
MLPCFNKLLDRFIEVEAGYNFKKSGKYLDTKVRPGVIGTWIGLGRGRRGGNGAKGAVFEAGSAAVDKFGDMLWDWWVSLQPAWRKPVGVTKTLPRSDEQRDAALAGDWAKLRIPGPNGVFMVVLVLYWWGRALGQNVKMTERWAGAVSDAKYMFDGLIALQRREDRERAVGDTDLETDQLQSASE